MTWPRPIPLVGDRTSARERRDDPTAWRFEDNDRSALYDIVMARRDIRRFRPDDIETALLNRVLGAAHAAPSVGHSQPWRFVIVRDPMTRERAAIFADRERLRQAKQLNEDAARRILDLQLEGIREAPLGIVVCCDRRTEPRGVLGRATYHDADLWSCACAIENLWLAARAEGLGVGWVTLFQPDDLAKLINLPSGVETLGWLCLGWPDERPPEPGLERVGWSRRLHLDDVILQERWPELGPNQPFSHARPPSQVEIVCARDEADALLTPPGSLGLIDRALDRLGSLGIVEVPRSRLFLVGADHPVAQLGVSTYGVEVTREILEASVAGESMGAAAALCADLELTVVDAGVLGSAIPGVARCHPVEHRGDMVNLDALSHHDVERLITFGHQLGVDSSVPSLVAVGEFGIGNTTVGAALAAAMLGVAPSETVGLGAGGDSATLERKASVVDQAYERALGVYGARSLRDPYVSLTALGGSEIAVLTGIILGVAEKGGAVVLDGFVTSLAALCAARIDAGTLSHLIAGQRSRERGHLLVLEELGLEPLLDMRLRAGEGIGATLSVQVLRTGLDLRRRTGRVRDPRKRESNDLNR